MCGSLVAGEWLPFWEMLRGERRGVEIGGNFILMDYFMAWKSILHRRPLLALIERSC